MKQTDFFGTRQFSGGRDALGFDRAPAFEGRWRVANRHRALIALKSNSRPGAVTILFTDIEGSTRLWEQEPERMRRALVCHDELLRSAVKSNHGVVVKMIGDGMQAAFRDPLDGLKATFALQQALADPAATNGLSLCVRCGLHEGLAERRDNDFFGSVVNRAARIMRAAHGGQVLLSQKLAVLLRDRLPAGVGLRDLGSVRLRDLANPERVYQVEHPQLRHDFPALRSLESTPNNLPQQVTSFIGRDRELTEVKHLLRDTRLLTLLGVGGIGKTRLSLQVAADVVDDYPDGVWFVELAPVADTPLVPQTVASVLGVKEEAGRPVLEALVKFVSDRKLLLVLDNCEHLSHACAELAKQLLRSGPHLKIFTSSREPLHVAGETTYTLPSLAVPDPRQTSTLPAVTQYEAVRLFVDRAEAAQPAFELTSQNAPAVAAICQRLDGIPLALELAAARVRALSAEKISARLNDRFHLLTGGDQTALPRQQTLRACIDWSYELLTEKERALLRRLAVFAGGWTLEAAETVGAGSEIEESDVLDFLSRLVEKSLVEWGMEGERYRLLETVRQYAQERLSESGEEQDVRARHLDFYLTLTEKAEPNLYGPDQVTWFAQLDPERENILAAHEWCDRAADGAELGLRLVHAVWRLWMNRGFLELGYRMTLEALGRTGAAERGLARCLALHAIGQCGFLMGRYEEAQRYLEEGLAIARELGDKGRVVTTLGLLGDVLQGRGDLVSAREHLEKAHALALELGDKTKLAWTLNSRAELYRQDGNLDAAEPLYEDALALQRGLGNPYGIALYLLNLAMLSIGRRVVHRVPAMLLEALAIANETGWRRIGWMTLEVSAGLATLSKEWDRTARLLGAAERQMKQMGFHRVPPDEAFLAPLMAKARQALGQNTFAAAESAGRSLSYEAAMSEAREWLEVLLTSAHRPH